MISEKIELIGKGVYKNIPDELTIGAIPTASELDYVSAEDFEGVMLDKILPKAVEEDINFHDLLEIDYQWITRCLRFVNYGPYFTTNQVICPKCGRIQGEARVDLRTIGVKVLPDKFVNDIKISKDEFLDFKKDIHIKLPTIQQMLNCYKDKMFISPDGKLNRAFARACYMITQIGNEKGITPVQAKMTIEKEMSSADYKIFLELVSELTDYGLRAAGMCECPQCHSQSIFIALADDKFFRPTLGDLRAGRNDRSARGAKNIPASETATV